MASAEPQDQRRTEYDLALTALTALRTGSEIAGVLKHLHQNPPTCTLLGGSIVSYAPTLINAALDALWNLGQDQHETFLEAVAPLTPLPTGPVRNSDRQLARLLAAEPCRHWDWYEGHVNRILALIAPPTTTSTQDENDNGIGPTVYDGDHRHLPASYLDEAPPPSPSKQRPHIRANNPEFTILITLINGLSSPRIRRDICTSLWKQAQAVLVTVDLHLPMAVHARLNTVVQDMLPLPQQEGAPIKQANKEWVTIAEAAAITGKTAGGIHNQTKQLDEASPGSIKKASGRILLLRKAVEKYLMKGSPDALPSPNTVKRRQQAKRPG
jgi:hypothetical protein